MGTAARFYGLIVPFTGQGTIPDGSLVVVGSADMSCTLPSGADPTSGVIGIAKREGGGSYSDGETVDVVTSGVGAGIAGATITRGQLVTAFGAAGTLKPAAPGAGVNDMVLGEAMESAVAGDRVGILVNPHLIQGA